MTTIDAAAGAAARPATAPSTLGSPNASNLANSRPASPVPADAATRHTAGPWLPATLLPGKIAGSGLSVELRIPPSPASADALVARVVAGGSGLALDLGGPRLALAPKLVDVPEGARLPLELRLPGSGEIVTDRAGLERLLSALPPPIGPAVPADAALAARLLAAWRRPTGGGAESPGETASRQTETADAGTGWRSLFDLTGAGSAPVAPVALWRRPPDPEAPAGQTLTEHLHLVIELSRLGRVAIDLSADARKLATTVTATAPLDADLRAAIGGVHAAAVELAGRSGSLAFRVASPGASLASPARSPDGLTV